MITEFQNFQSKVRMARAVADVSEAELARRLGTTPQAFHSRMKSPRFSAEELVEIADALGMKYESYFVLPDGSKI